MAEVIVEGIFAIDGDAIDLRAHLPHLRSEPYYDISFQGALSDKHCLAWSKLVFNKSEMYWCSGTSAMPFEW